MMTPLHVIFGLGPPPIKNPGCAYAGEGGNSSGAPQINACARRARTNLCASSRGPANFCRKTGRQKRFFSMKQQHRSSERDQVA